MAENKLTEFEGKGLIQHVNGVMRICVVLSCKDGKDLHVWKEVHADDDYIEDLKKRVYNKAANGG